MTFCWIAGSIGVAMLLYLCVAEWLYPISDLRHGGRLMDPASPLPVSPSSPSPPQSVPAPAVVALPPAFLQSVIRTQGAHSTRAIKEEKLKQAQAAHDAAAAELAAAKKALHDAIDQHWPG